MVHDRLEQPGSAEPLAEPRSEPRGARPCLQQDPVPTARYADAPPLQGDRGQGPRRVERLAPGAQLLHLPPAALVSLLGRLAAAPCAAAASPRSPRAAGGREAH